MAAHRCDCKLCIDALREREREREGKERKGGQRETESEWARKKERVSDGRTDRHREPERDWRERERENIIYLPILLS